MSDELPSEEELLKLPPSSIAVYALRCALRVQPLLVSWENPTAEYKKAIVSLKTVYNLLVPGGIAARIKYPADAASTATKSTYLSYAAARMGANTAFTYTATDAEQAATAAADAADIARTTYAVNNAAPKATHSAARVDYAQLLELKSEVRDASENGPLGDLWHGSTPTWYIDRKKNYDKTIAEWEHELGEEKGESAEELANRFEESDPDPLISVYFDECDFTKEEMADFIKYISESYRSLGGEGLKVVDGKTLLPENIGVEV